MTKKNRGFTLVELLVVISIIGLLSTMATAALNSARKKSKIAKAQHDTDQLMKAIQMLGNDTGVWPGHIEVGISTTSPSADLFFCGDNSICTYSVASSTAGIVENDGTYENWGGPYMKKKEIDAWGCEYFFNPSYDVNVDNNPCAGGGGCSDAAVVGSNGPDMTFDTADDIIKILAK